MAQEVETLSALCAGDPKTAKGQPDTIASNCSVEAFSASVGVWTGVSIVCALSPDSTADVRGSVTVSR